MAAELPNHNALIGGSTGKGATFGEGGRGGEGECCERREKQWVERQEVGLIEELRCGGGSRNPSAREGYRGEDWSVRWERREQLGGFQIGRAHV